jgi:hypothetical protein
MVTQGNLKAALKETRPSLSDMEKFKYYLM